MLFWILVAATVALAAWRLTLGYPKPTAQLTRLRRGEAAFLDAAADAMFLDGGSIPLSGRDAEVPRYLDRAFEVLHVRQRRLVRLLLLLMEQVTILFPAPGRRGFRRFSSLSRDQRAAVLSGWAQSRLYPRRMIFSSLRAILVMAYLSHPAVQRHLRLAPLEIRSPVCEADLLYPRIGQHPSQNPLGEADLTPPSDGTPLDLNGPLHPDFRESPL